MGMGVGVGGACMDVVRVWMPVCMMCVMRVWCALVFSPGCAGLMAADGDGEGEALEGSTEIGSERLLQILMERGEAFTKEELEDCFCVLLGERVLPVSLQHQVDAHTFATHVLRLPKTDSDPSFATPSAEAESNAPWGTTAVQQQQPQ
eukprot:GHVU01169610.1.p2 GENE.GHVU01169610.1~~GHVU01169610.1.p2  ORF type:complete len:148 (-),score=24.33 GHVU01169610.1:204-647(-)